MWDKIDLSGNQVDPLLLFLASQNTFMSPALAIFEYRLEGENQDNVKFHGFKKNGGLCGKSQKS